MLVSVSKCIRVHEWTLEEKLQASLLSFHPLVSGIGFRSSALKPMVFINKPSHWAQESIFKGVKLEGTIK